MGIAASDKNTHKADDVKSVPTPTVSHIPKPFTAYSQSPSSYQSSSVTTGIFHFPRQINFIFVEIIFLLNISIKITSTNRNIVYLCDRIL